MRCVTAFDRLQKANNCMKGNSKQFAARTHKQPRDELSPWVHCKIQNTGLKSPAYPMQQLHWSKIVQTSQLGGFPYTLILGRASLLLNIV
jgi:hypothetical protein